ncbi:MAG: DNA polymerase III subunit delta [Candidatus Eisenbacteria bacterium]
MKPPWGTRPLEFDRFLEILEKAGAPSTLLVSGPEVLLRDAILSRMARSVLAGQGGEGRWNRELYQARETSLSVLSAGLRVTSLFAESRLVVLSEPERYGRAAQADRADFWEWMEQPAPGVHLVLTTEKQVWELERANEFVKGTLERCDAVVRCDHPSPERAVALIIRMARERHGLTLPQHPARRLVAAVGPNLLDLSQEIDRLALRLGPDGKVDDATLENWLRSGVVGSLADLEEALLVGDAPRALLAWTSVQRNATVPAMTWMLGSKHLATGWGRGSGGASGGRIGPRVSRLLRACYRLERAVKTGEIPSSLQDVAFEEMIVRLCSGRAARPGASATQQMQQKEKR